MSPSSLQVLADNRNALLLAEVAAWLHMLGKFHEKFLGGNYGLATQIPSEIPADFPQLNQWLTDTWTGQIWAQMGIQEFQAANLSIASLITTHQNPNAPTGFERLMWDAHGRGSGSEKGALERFFAPQQGKVYLSTAFGHEAQVASVTQNEREDFYRWLEGQLAHLNQDQVDWGQFRPAFLAEIRRLFSATVAETRRPINDVALFDQTFASVAVFKAALAQNLWMGWKEPKQSNQADKYHWRILRVGIDGLRFWGNAPKLTDVLGRKAALEKALDAVQRLLEEECPLGAEVYRDENGSLFIVPDIPDLLDARLDGGSLQDRLQAIAKAALEDEALFVLTLSKRTRNMLSFGQLASAELLPPSADPDVLRSIWKARQETTDICPVCGVRPQGYAGAGQPLDQKALSRNVCGICERRRMDRSAEWAKNLKTTVWTDEVADQNGRLALLVGCFELETWLSGETLSSVMAFEPSQRMLTDNRRNNQQYQFDYSQFLNEIAQALPLAGQPGNQTPLLNNLLLPAQRVGQSFADTYDFYVSDTDLHGDQREAWRFALALMRQQPSPARLRRIWETTQRFWQTALEEKDDQGNPLISQVSSRWYIVPQNSTLDKFVAYHTYDLLLNGRRLSVLWDGGEFITCDNLEYFEKVASVQLQDLLQPGSSYELWTPAGYGERTSKVANITIESAQADSTAYTPVIPILAEPRTFMVLVPAIRTMEVVKAIKRKYERELGKVRNRLPLTLGVVYFGRRTPLAAAIETGRRMLKRPVAAQVWEVHSKADCNPSAVCLTLKNGERQISISIPAMMGDGATPDLWYPYWRVEGKPTDRTRWFIGPDGEHWVHITDLRPGDRVGFTPSTFDFEYLDTTARRFEVIYDAEGQRREATKRQRPYLLEDVETLEAIWKQLSARLTTSQVKQIEASIESKRQAWNEPRGTLQVSPAFQQFVQDTLREAGFQSEMLEQAALRGMMSDALEIYMMIHKEKIGKELSQKEAK
ncbi:MAG: CRISPR-associated protein Csx11 [Candidatus Micrarchaeia archaeon]